MYEIVKKEWLHEVIFLIEIKTPAIAKKIRAGNFLVLRMREGAERIPITVADYNREKGTVTCIIQVIGQSTKLLSTLEEGDHIKDVVGPLGNPTEIEKYGTVGIVSGGLGIPLANLVAKELKEAGNKVIGMVGARTEELLVWEEEMSQYCEEMQYCTDDGSKGMKGFTTHLLEEKIAELAKEKKKLDMVFTVGPTIMMKFVTQITKKHEIPTIASLNPIMVDGTGMCGACRVTIDGKIQFACVDGPEFDAHKVDFDELINRLAQYKNQEKVALDKYDKECGGKHK
ncbi:MAG: sulfide/dihydroorotate dehydrogenase-like FAD/NAD-binding protein [Candidatus Heimdallarchaeota archaeon]|nr:sulfide/dihydroorotate dehydrogenase-like FAD/NAD-binding protein [Candidatus Heimdallarchaeota archaeon]MCG3252640.1 sulfide/dihydroorotate dehydrogenase-like FAD/NAD-binding protein [Candidatus Heimdallarchaeota archaeon]MCK4289778.1 sulfide/dihydroorotate dehydrogenase-like FAD/NAD-binding protein [Candidatus Heimdallarchaeota archaeon]